MGAVFARGSILAALLIFCLAPLLTAQIHGTAPSVTSFGFGGSHNHAPGVRASVTSLGRFGWSGGHRSGFGTHCCVNTFGTHRRRTGFYGGYIPVYAYAVPYGTEYFDEPEDETADDQYLGGPTIFDRRGPGSDRFESSPPRPREESLAATPAPAAPEPDQPQTVLVFKDGHKLEVQNYAIVGDTLYNLEATRGRKIALSELDLKATVRENDDRGIDFRLPPGLQVNDIKTN
jgi:hypothetical protein